MGFADLIPLRKNSDTGLVDASWWNVIRSALISTFDSENFGATNFTIANNQSSYANITNLIFDKDEFTTYRLYYEIYRKSDAPTERMEVGYITATFKAVANSWTFSRRTEHGDDVLNVDVSLYVDPSTGQVQYKSDNMSGANYVGLMKYKVVTTFVVAS